jgi:mRNA-degrading endonuclease YafQ of YafQ-DinJ toxin-antitoxin module
MRIRITAAVERKLRKLFRRHPELANLFDERIRMFLEQPRHPALRTHKLSGLNQQTWSIFLTGDLRMLFVYDEKGVLVIDVGPHDEVY